LTSITLPHSLTVIGCSAFTDCFQLAEITLPISLRSIESQAFYGCLRLTEITFPDSLTAIRSRAFARCSGIKRIYLPSGVHSIEPGSFQGCISLLDVELPTSVTTLDSRYDNSLTRGAFEGCTSLRTLVLPPALEALNARDFRGSTGNLRMLVISPKASAAVTTTVVASMKYDSDSYRLGEFVRPSLVQLVAAPDVVVASLGGVFEGMATMAEVRAAGRDVATILDYHYWSVKTHVFHICTAAQRHCAHTLLLIGARLEVLPDELWVEVLMLLRRDELASAE
jgi:hypothetical protein